MSNRILCDDATLNSITHYDFIMSNSFTLNAV